jgi:hypothetical protein
LREGIDPLTTEPKDATDNKASANPACESRSM